MERKKFLTLEGIKLATPWLVVRGLDHTALHAVITMPTITMPMWYPQI